MQHITSRDLWTPHVRGLSELSHRSKMCGFAVFVSLASKKEAVAKVVNHSNPFYEGDDLYDSNRNAIITSASTLYVPVFNNTWHKNNILNMFAVIDVFHVQCINDGKQKQK